MEETPSPCHTPLLTSPSVPEYWCYQCNKRVRIQTLPDQPGVICSECNNAFIDHPQPLEVNNDDHQNSTGDEFLQFLRLIARAMRDDINVIDNDENHNQEFQNEVDRVHDGSNNHEQDEDLCTRQPQNVVRIQLRGMAAQAYNRGHTILDADEMRTGIENGTIQISFQVPGHGDGYITNPRDYVNAPGFEQLFENLVESCGSGAPPAAKSEVEALQTVEIKSTNGELCAVCKEKLFKNEGEIVKKLACGHMYHGNCIVRWLGCRNTCPVCRYEMRTDDPDYEEDRKKRLAAEMASTVPVIGPI